jgi:hypothetical protein
MGGKPRYFAISRACKLWVVIGNDELSALSSRSEKKLRRLLQIPRHRQKPYPQLSFLRGENNPDDRDQTGRFPAAIYIRLLQSCVRHAVPKIRRQPVIEPIPPKAQLR